MKIKILSTLFAITALASFSMPAYSFSMCASIQNIANQDQAAFNSANQAWQQACGSNPSSNQCAAAHTNLMQAAATANASSGAAQTCRIFYSID